MTPIIEEPRDSTPTPNAEGGSATDDAKPAMLIPTTVVTQADVSDHKDEEAVAADDEPADADDKEQKSAEQKEKPSSGEEKDKKKQEKKDGAPGTSAPQPIFKPLITEKGKSKSSGRTIGGWL